MDVKCISLFILPSTVILVVQLFVVFVRNKEEEEEAVPMSILLLRLF